MRTSDPPVRRSSTQSDQRLDDLLDRQAAPVIVRPGCARDAPKTAPVPRALVSYHQDGESPGMSESDERKRFRQLPDPVPSEDTVESVDTASIPAPDASDERDRFLREAGGG